MASCLAAKKRRAQSSLEALLAFASLLFAILILASAARGFTASFIAQSSDSGLRIALAHEALLLDTSSWAAGSSKITQNISAIPGEGKGEIRSRQNPVIFEPVFSSPTQGMQGEIYVRKNPFEPV
jgi:hypothetical protein